MQTIEPLKRKIKSAQDLLSVVKTMKVLAAVSIRQYEKAMESLVEYNRTVEMGLQVVLKQRPEGIRIAEPVLKERLGVIIFGSDQGMVGQFNEVIARHAVSEMNKLQVKQKNRMVLAVGMRVISSLEEAGQPVEEYFSLPGSTAAITPAVEDLALKMEEWRSQEKIDQIVIFYNRESGASYSPHTIHLWPVDSIWFQDLEQKPWPSRAVPFFTMDWNRLFSSLIQQYLFVSLYRAFAESLASENAGRLASMQAAERNIEDLLEELNFQFHQQRQSSITEELLDIVAGFEALR
ncbi:MAG: F0F1 ATP synthase subunit gamma [Proteobacteria bacterium]|nr:F0F1 ATP synthase subunit gamma [Pseudomonadota bacterium]